MKDSDWQILYELHRTPNITKVANRLYITQPSLTKRLQYIEEEFKIKIANRTTKGIKFTKEGEFLAIKADQYISFIEQIRKELRDLQDDTKFIIVIGASYTYSKYVLSDILYEYSKQNPNVGFDVQSAQSNLLFRKVCDGDVDVAFVNGDYYDEGVIQKKIDVSQAYVLTKEPVRLEDLPNMARIDFLSNDRSIETLKQWWMETFEEEYSDGMSAGYVDVAWQFASRGLGYALCFISHAYPPNYDLVKMPLFYKDKSPVTRNSWFVYKEKKDVSKNLCKFVQYINETIAINK